MVVAGLGTHPNQSVSHSRSRGQLGHKGRSTGRQAVLSRAQVRQGKGHHGPAVGLPSSLRVRHPSPHRAAPLGGPFQALEVLVQAPLAGSRTR